MHICNCGYTPLEFGEMALCAHVADEVSRTYNVGPGAVFGFYPSPYPPSPQAATPPGAYAPGLGPLGPALREYDGLFDFSQQNVQPAGAQRPQSVLRCYACEPPKPSLLSPSSSLP